MGWCVWNLRARTIRSNGRRYTRAIEVRKSSSVEQPGNTFRERTRGRVAVKTRACRRFTADRNVVIFGIHWRAKSRDARSAIVFHKWYNCDTQRAPGLDICVFINTRGDRVTIRVFDGRIRGVWNHCWAPHLHRYVDSNQIRHLRRESKQQVKSQQCARTGGASRGGLSGPSTDIASMTLSSGSTSWIYASILDRYSRKKVKTTMSSTYSKRFCAHLVHVDAIQWFSSRKWGIWLEG